MENSNEVTGEALAVAPVAPAAENRKRRNRWDDASESTPDTPAICLPVEGSTLPTNGIKSETSDDAVKKARRSRWATAEEPPAAIQAPAFPATAFAVPIMSEEVIQQSLVLKLQLQQINQQLLTVVADAARIEQDPNRSASPPPRYDASGKRTNTREVRMREALNSQRADIIEKLIKMNPNYQPPIDFVKAKPFKRLYIPKQADPMVNYIGLIIGPRGMTQKELEAETGCKISIRGKGSAKEGSKGRASKNIDDDEELHVHIQGDDMDKVDLAIRKIEQILRPLDDTLNEHKQKQLKQLALINGTLRENEYCPVCGEKGHQQFDCPYRAKAFKAAGVKCSICGDLSHPTRDCPMRNEGPSNESVIESEYDNFIAELTGGGGKSSKPKGEISTENDVKVSADGDGVPSGGAVRAVKPNGQTILAPIVNVMTRKPQTVIHVSTVLTGAAPPSLANNSGSVSYPSAPLPPTATVPPPMPYGAPVPSAPLPYAPYGYPPAPYPNYYGYNPSYQPGVMPAGPPAPQPYAPPPPPPAHGYSAGNPPPPPPSLT